MFERFRFHDTKKTTNGKPSGNRKPSYYESHLRNLGLLKPLKPFFGLHTPDRVANLQTVILRNRDQIRNELNDPAYSSAESDLPEFAMVRNVPEQPKKDVDRSPAPPSGSKNVSSQKSGAEKTDPGPEGPSSPDKQRPQATLPPNIEKIPENVSSQKSGAEKTDPRSGGSSSSDSLSSQATLPPNIEKIPKYRFLSEIRSWADGIDDLVAKVRKKDVDRSPAPPDGPEYRFLSEIRTWADGIDALVAELAGKSKQDYYGRFPPMFDAGARKERKKSKAIRKEGMRKLLAEANDSARILNMLMKERKWVDAAQSVADILDPGEGKKSVVLVDFHYTMATLQDGRFVFAPDMVDTMWRYRRANIEFSPTTGAEWEKLREEILEANDDPKHILNSKNVLSEGHFFPSYSDEIWFGGWPKQNGYLRDKRLKRYVREAKALRRAIQARINEDPVIGQYAGKKVDGIPLVDVRPKSLAGSVYAPNLLKRYIRETLKIVDDTRVEQMAAAVDERMLNIIKSVLKEHRLFEQGQPSLMKYALRLKERMVIKELRKAKVDLSNPPLALSSKAGAVDYLCDELGVNGGGLGSGDFVADAPIAQRFRERTRAGQMTGWAFIGVVDRNGVVDEEIKRWSTFIVDNPAVFAKLLKKAIIVIEKRRGISRGDDIREERRREDEMAVKLKSKLPELSKLPEIPEIDLSEIDLSGLRGVVNDPDALTFSGSISDFYALMNRLKS